VTAPIEIRVAFDVGRCAPNACRRMVWQQRKRVADAAKEAAGVAWLQAGSPMLDEPVSVDITIRRGRRLDPDALLASCKSLLDSLFVMRITPDDSARWVRYGEVRQETGARFRGREEVLVRVRPQEVP
jgi:hypothetical protein